MLHLLTQPSDRFEKMYLKAREKEGRVYSVEQIQKLPQVDKTHPHAAEWEVRTKSLKAFLNYLDQREDVQRILEIGCGNGWFAAAIAAQFPEVNVVGCDLNMLELKQAEEAFNLENLDFVYANIFEDWPQQWQQYDLVVLPSSVQYFKNFKKLIEQLFTLAGEVHIIDSPFYATDELEAARQRTARYYHDLGLPEMANSYFHHSCDALKDFNSEYLYRPPQGWRKRFARSPFPWIKLLKAKS